MRIVVDPGVLIAATSSGCCRTGVYRVAAELLRFFHRAPGVSFSLPVPDAGKANSLNHVLLRDFPAGFAEYGYPPARWAMEAIDRFLPYVKRINLERPSSWSRFRALLSDGVYARGRAALLLQRLLHGWLHRRRASCGDVFLSPRDPLPDAPAGMPRLVTVHDILPLTHPEWFPEDSGHHDFLAQLVASIRGTDWVVAVSEATRSELLAYCPSFKPSQVVVSYPGAGASFSPRGKEECQQVRERHGIPSGAPYFLGVSTIEIRKNFARVVEAFSRLVRSGEGGESRLVLVGPKGWQTEEIYKHVASDPVLAERVVFTGYVPDEDLPALYSDAVCFVYPSLGEGFGLPVVEAMRCGTAVVTSCVSSLPEVAGQAAELVDPTDVAAIEVAMRALATDSDRRERCERAGLAQAEAFTWERFGNGVLEILAEMRAESAPER